MLNEFFPLLPKHAPAPISPLSVNALSTFSVPQARSPGSILYFSFTQADPVAPPP